MRYISLFSGAGGLEHPGLSCSMLCEADVEAATVLGRRFPRVPVASDVRDLHPDRADIVAGGWPCQDISVAGLRRGLEGERSGLFFELVRVAEEAQAATIVAENVPNLLRLEGGRTFALVIAAFNAAGYPFVAWRTLNAREFGLPHERKRVFIVASKHRDIAHSIHRQIECDERDIEREPGGEAAGFYWTAGLQSICYSRGFTPTLKVGSSLSIPAAPAVHFDDVVRMLTPEECVSLQGFPLEPFEGMPAKAIYRMMGNAVAAPVGHWVMRGVTGDVPNVNTRGTGFGYYGPSGFSDRGEPQVVEHEQPRLATNLRFFLDSENRSMLSIRAAAGLVDRLRRSGKPCPDELFRMLLRITGEAGASQAQMSSLAQLSTSARRATIEQIEIGR